MKINQLPKLQRQPMRPEDKPGAEKECWQPRWRCFCCHDRGTIIPILASLVIEGYDPQKDKLPLCQNPDCEAGKAFYSPTLEECIDERISPAVCQQLDLIERENWHQTRLQWHQMRQKPVDLSTIGKNLRGASRSAQEQMEAERKHEEIISQYSGDKTTNSELLTNSHGNKTYATRPL
ncbi:MAG: hypothetical protein F6K24_27320 [Okeania sp. SIO2D1]|nr:hypothetical protein [Okeania sp. SIO2D1]